MIRVLVCLILIQFGCTRQTPRESASPGPAVTHQAQSVDQVVAELARDGRRDRVEEAYRARTGQVRTSSAMAAVVYTCIDKFHRDSCLHHLIKCGPACRPILPDKKFAEIRSEYWKLMKERGLAK